MARLDRLYDFLLFECSFLFAFDSNYARYSDLLVENREIFIPHLYLAHPQEVTSSEFREDVCYS